MTVRPPPEFNFHFVLDVDDTACITIKYAGKRMVQLMYSGTTALPNSAHISGTKGRIEVNNFTVFDIRYFTVSKKIYCIRYSILYCIRYFTVSKKNSFKETDDRSHLSF